MVDYREKNEITIVGLSLQWSGSIVVRNGQALFNNGNIDVVARLLDDNILLGKV